MRYAINGLLSLTPDGAPILGETPEVKGLWSAAAVWIKEGPGVGRAVAEWMTDGEPEIDLAHSDIARFYPHQQHPRARQGAHRARRSTRPTASCTPASSASPTATSGSPRCTPRRRSSARSSSRPPAGSGRSGTSPTPALLEEYGDRVMPREHEWDARWWSPIINAEHLAMRDRAGIVDLSAFAIFDVVGPGALAAVQRDRASSQCDVPVGRVVYTPVLDERGGFRSDLTVMRLAHDHFRVVTGGAHGMADRKWFADQMPADGSAPGRRPDLGVHHDRPLGPAGPRHPRRAHPRRRLPRGLPVRHLPRRSRSARCSVLASRISYVGELGWELYVPIEQGARLWDCCSRPARRTAPCRSASASTAPPGRIEKGYRAYGSELDAERTIVEAGMAAAEGQGRPTSSDARPTSSSARRTRRRCCAR